MSRANEYRRKAEESEEAAERVKDLQVKEAYREIANKWRELERAANAQRRP